MKSEKISNFTTVKKLILDKQHPFTGCVEQVMQVANFSVPLERFAGMRLFQGLRKPPG